MKGTTSDIFLLHFIVLVWGGTAVLGLLMTMGPVEIVFYRTGLAAIMLAGILKFRKKSFGISSPSALIKIITVGALLAVHWVLFFLSARVATASVCLAGMATTSFWTSLIEPLYFKKKVQVFEVVLSLMALSGILVIFNVESGYMLGLSLAIGAALCAAWFSIINVSVTKTDDHFVITFYEMLFACLIIGVFIPFYLSNWSKQMDIPNAEDWVYLLILSGICTVFAFSYSVKLMKKLSAFFINLTINLEPVYGILLALLFFGEKERMSDGFYLGTVLILLSVLIYPIWNNRLKRKALEREKLG